MKILVRAPNWLGDIVMSFGFFNKLEELFPNSQIDIIVKEQFGDIFTFFNFIGKVYKFSKKDIEGIKNIYKYSKMNFTNEKYDLYFSLPDSFSTAITGYFAKAEARVGYKKEMRSIFLTDSYKLKQNIHRVEKYVDLIYNYLNIEEENRGEINLSLKNDIEFDKIQNPTGVSNYIVVNMNSEAVSRKLPFEKWAYIIMEIIEKLDCSVVLTGMKKEKEEVDRMTKILNNPKIVNLCGKTNIKELFKIIKEARVLVSNDSGPAHIANAIGTSLVVVFGAGDEKETGPYIKENSYVVRNNRAKCAPCVSNVCKTKTMECMKDIDESIIVRKATEFYNRKKDI